MTTTNLTSLEVSKLTAVMTGGGYKRAASKEAAVARYLKTAEEVGMADAATLLGDEYGFDTAHHVLVERNKGGHASISEALADASLIEDSESAALAERYQAEAEALLSLQTGEETSEGEVGRWKQTDDGPVWTARRPARSEESAVAHQMDHGDTDAPMRPVGTLVGRVSVEDATNGKEPKAESKTAMLLRLAQTPEGVTNAKMKELTGWTKLGGFFNAAKNAGLELTRVRENGDTTWRAAPAGDAEAGA